MKYILMMAAPKAGFETYRKWSEKDVQAHMTVMRAISKDLSESGSLFPQRAWRGPNRPSW